MRSHPEHRDTRSTWERRVPLLREARPPGKLIRAFGSERTGTATRQGVATGTGVLPDWLKRGLIYLCVAAAVFLAGLVPLWRRARAGEEQAVATQR
jgi:hypothetical protein